MCLGSQPHMMPAVFQRGRPATHTTTTTCPYITAMRASSSPAISVQSSNFLHPSPKAYVIRASQQPRNMRGPSSASKGDMASFKRDLLENLLRGLRANADACSFDAMMSVEERKRAVKRSADVAMAAARAAAAGGGRARWPKAILEAAGAASSGSSSPGACKARSRCRRVVRRCVSAKRARSSAAAASSSDVARRLVRRRTMALRSVIPGGSATRDEAALLREAMDYVVHLRAQVDVLRRVSATVQRSTFPRDPAQSMGES